MARILVADSIAAEGIERLRQQHDVEVRTGLSEDELVAAAADVSALIVRSQAQVTTRVIEAAQRLEVIGRAGVGVDNIDVEAATRRGIVVVNAPLANTLSTAEHAVGLMLALARHTAPAYASLKDGRWDRNKYMGVELAGHTLGVVGLGRIGSEVATRARAFQMRVIAFDPYVSEDRARALGVELAELDELLAAADFVTLHTALHDGTRNLINRERLALMKQGARIVNTARGALIDEQALYEAVESGHLAGAAIDVFSKEPAVGNILTTSDRILVTPHLAASTHEAQQRAAMDVVDQVISVLDGGPARFAVNVPFVDTEALAVIGPYVEAAQRAASVAMQLANGQPQWLRIEYLGEIANYNLAPVRAAAIVGALQRGSVEKVTAVNADTVAERHGLRIEEAPGPARPPYSNLVLVRIGTSEGEFEAGATLTGDGVHVVHVGDFDIDISPRAARYVLAVENVDKPGTIGRVGTTLGGWAVNISFMSVAPGPNGRALMVLGIDRTLTTEELASLQDQENVFSARQLDLA